VIDVVYVFILMIVLSGSMLFAFYLGARKGEEKIINRKLEPENMDVPQEPTEEEYLKSINAWMPNGESTNESTDER